MFLSYLFQYDVWDQISKMLIDHRLNMLVKTLPDSLRLRMRGGGGVLHFMTHSNQESVHPRLTWIIKLKNNNLKNNPKTKDNNQQQQNHMNKIIIINQTKTNKAWLSKR